MCVNSKLFLWTNNNNIPAFLISLYIESNRNNFDTTLVVTDQLDLTMGRTTSTKQNSTADRVIIGDITSLATTYRDMNTQFPLSMRR